MIYYDYFLLVILARPRSFVVPVRTVRTVRPFVPFVFSYARNRCRPSRKRGATRPHALPRLFQEVRFFDKTKINLIGLTIFPTL